MFKILILSMFISYYNGSKSRGMSRPIFRRNLLPCSHTCNTDKGRAIKELSFGIFTWDLKGLMYIPNDDT